MLANLRKALDDDNENDFTEFMASAYSAKLKIITILSGMQLQMTSESGREQEGQLARRQTFQSTEDREHNGRGGQILNNYISGPPPFAISPSYHSPPVTRNDRSNSTCSYPGNLNRNVPASSGEMTAGQSDPSRHSTSPGIQSHSNRVPIPVRNHSQTSENSAATSPPISLSESAQSLGQAPFFCTGAYLLQASRSAEKSGGIKRYNQSSAMTGENYVWVCKSNKCAFEGRACRVRSEWKVDGSAREISGLRIRWLFFAKSHVEQRKIKKGIRHYRCLLCALNRVEILPLLEGEQSLLTHVLLHKGGTFGDVLLRGPIRFGRDFVEKATEDTFDVSFPEKDMEEQSLSQASTTINSDGHPSNDLFSWPDDARSVFDGWNDKT